MCWLLQCNYTVFLLLDIHVTYIVSCPVEPCNSILRKIKIQGLSWQVVICTCLLVAKVFFLLCLSSSYAIRLAYVRCSQDGHCSHRPVLPDPGHSGRHDLVLPDCSRHSPWPCKLSCWAWSFATNGSFFTRVYILKPFFYFLLIDVTLVFSLLHAMLTCLTPLIDSLAWSQKVSHPWMRLGSAAK
jgi:hypothetical protein